MTDNKEKPGLFGRMFGRGKSDNGASMDDATQKTSGAATAGEGAATDAAPPATTEPPEKRSWLQRLTGGLAKTSGQIAGGITSLFTQRKLDADTLEDLEDLLIQSDIGIETATRICDAIGKGRFDKSISPDEVRGILSDEVTKILEPIARPLEINNEHSPHVVLVVGVNGAGKTTTIGKLAAQYKEQGLKVHMAAGDTFRAAAIDQLKVWGERTGSKVVARDVGSDSSGLAYDALAQARDEGADVLLVDTAGRLQNKSALMDELDKVIRVMRKIDASRTAHSSPRPRCNDGAERLESSGCFRPKGRGDRVGHDQA